MTNKDKLIKKLMNSPKNIKYSELEPLFKDKNFFIIKEGKGSHRLIIGKKNQTIVSVPIHNNDCLPVYKEKLLALYLLNS